MRPVVAAIALCGAFASTSLPAHAGPDVALIENPDFEAGSTDGVPTGWYVPPPVRDGGYEVRLSEDEPASGSHCVRISWNGTTQRGAFGNILQGLDPAALRGHRFVLTSKLRASGGGQAQMWLRVDRPGGAMGFFDNMGDRPVRTAEWATARISGVVDADAVAVTFGAMLIGEGAAGVDDFHLEVDAVSSDDDGESDGHDLVLNGRFDAGSEGWKAQVGTREQDWSWDALTRGTGLTSSLFSTPPRHAVPAPRVRTLRPASDAAGGRRRAAHGASPRGGGPRL